MEKGANSTEVRVAITWKTIIKVFGARGHQGPPGTTPRSLSQAFGSGGQKSRALEQMLDFEKWQADASRSYRCSPGKAQMPLVRRTSR